MLDRLKFEAIFSTGFTVKDEHRFKEGLTTISGPNESGKSLRLEFVRYALFGTEALRAKADTYRKLDIELDFRVRGQSYTVKRARNALLTSGGVSLASGTRAVNEKIQTILGYGIAVFDVANACTQGQIEALGNMRPADRKAMIDETVGLGRIDEAAEWVGECARNSARLAEAMKSRMVLPEEPVKPEDYQPVGELKAQLDTLKLLVSEIQTLRGWLSAEPPKPEGDEPEPPCKASLKDLTDRQMRRETLIMERKGLENERVRLPLPTRLTENEVQAALECHRAADAFDQAQALLRTLPAPIPMTREKLAEIEGTITLHERWEQRQKLLAEGHNECPACKHRWPLACDRLAAYADVPETVEKPLHSRAWLNTTRGYLDSFEASLPRRQMLEAVAPVGRPSQTVAELQQAQAALVHKARRDAINDRLPEIDKELTDTPDQSGLIEKLRAYHMKLARWGAYQDWLEKAKPKRERYLELQHVEGSYDLISSQLSRCTRYETLLESYERQLGQYEQTKKDVEGLEADAEDWKKARAGLAEVKVRVKQHLLPSLSKVASMLIEQMTAGKRKSILLDSDFNIFVDGQALDTLSGSTKAVANLAMRIGLGQVLTNRVFSVFMGDELDAAMDQERAGLTAECLRNLTKSISQIIVVSHKSLEADHHVEL